MSKPFVYNKLQPAYYNCNGTDFSLDLHSLARQFTLLSSIAHFDNQEPCQAKSCQCSIMIHTAQHMPTIIVTQLHYCITLL